MCTGFVFCCVLLQFGTSQFYWHLIALLCWHSGQLYDYPDSKVHGANMGPIWGRQNPGGPHIGPMLSGYPVSVIMSCLNRRLLISIWEKIILLCKILSYHASSRLVYCFNEYGKKMGQITYFAMNVIIKYEELYMDPIDICNCYLVSVWHHRVPRYTACVMHNEWFSHSRDGEALVKWEPCIR